MRAWVYGCTQRTDGSFEQKLLDRRHTYWQEAAGRMACFDHIGWSIMEEGDGLGDSTSFNFVERAAAVSGSSSLRSVRQERWEETGGVFAIDPGRCDLGPLVCAADIARSRQRRNWAAIWKT